MINALAVLSNSILIFGNDWLQEAEAKQMAQTPEQTEEKSETQAADEDT